MLLLFFICPRNSTDIYINTSKFLSNFLKDNNIFLYSAIFNNLPINTKNIILLDDYYFSSTTKFELLVNFDSKLCDKVMVYYYLFLLLKIQLI